MKEIGSLLKQTRESQGKTLEEISSQTKIQLPTLQSLENGDFGRLTNKAFLKGFIRQYAKALGLNADELLATFDKSTAGTPEPKPMPVSKLDSNQLTEKTNVLWFRAPSQFITLAAVAIILVLITSIYFISMKIVSYSQETVRAEKIENPSENSSDNLTPPSPEILSTNSPSPASEPVKADSKSPSEQQTQAEIEDEESERPKGNTIAPAIEPKQKMVTLEARSEVIIDAAWSTGKTETVKLIANSKHIFYYREKIKVVVSDGSAVKVQTHEKNLGIPGEAGKPITMNFN